MKYFILLSLFLLMGCASVNDGCGFDYHKINYKVIDINLDNLVSKGEFTSYMEQIFGAMDKDKSGDLSQIEIYGKASCE